MSNFFECDKCALNKNSKAITGIGPKDADIMLIGQCPGPDELQGGIPFIGKSGRKVDEALQNAGLDRKQIYITNAVKCYVKPGKTLSKTFVRICTNEYLSKEIMEVKPKVILVLGSVASQFFGKRFIPNSHFYNDKYNCYVVITHHPAKLLYSYSDKLHKAFKGAFVKTKELVDKQETKTFKPKIDIILDAKEVDKYDQILGDIVSVDLETTGLNFLEDKILTVGISDGKTHLGIKYHNNNVTNSIRKILSKRKIVGQNYNFDYKFLKKEGIETYSNVYFDTKLAHFLIDREAPHNLDALALKYLHTKLTKGTIDFDNVDIDNIDYQEYCTYVGNDASMQFAIYEILNKEIAKNYKKIFYQIIMPSSVWLAEAEFYGVKIDRDYVNSYINSIKYEIKTVQSDIENNPDIKAFCSKMGLPIFNVRSPKQLHDFIYDYLKLKCNDGNTAESTLVFLTEKYPQYDILKKVVKYRHLYKSYRTYLTNLIKFSEIDGSIHCQYDQCRVPTGRLASRNPNLQNIPKGGELAKGIRKAFVAREGYTLIEADFKQAEFRALAHYSRDPHMIKLINEGVDIHRMIASVAYMKKQEEITSEERRIAKSIVFGLMYGRGVKSIAAQFKIPVTEAQNIKDTFFGTFRQASAWLDKAKNFAKKHGYVKNLFGRKITIPQMYSKDRERVAYGVRCAVNYPIQGAAADMTNLAGALIFKKFKEENIDARIIMNIHDSIIIECKDEILEIVKNKVRQVMVHDVKVQSDFRVELGIDIVEGKNLAFI